jgi:hypothetical protein
MFPTFAKNLFSVAGIIDEMNEAREKFFSFD